MAINKKPDFNAPADHSEHADAKRAAAGVSVQPLLGTWTNCDKATRGIVEVILTAEGGLTVQAFGACSPTPCDWGKVKGIAYAANVSSTEAVAFSAQYKFGFKETILVGALERGSLVVETFDHFTDGSGRSDYYSKYFLCKHER
jgi:hypothetical protein